MIGPKLNRAANSAIQTIVAVLMMACLNSEAVSAQVKTPEALATAPADHLLNVGVGLDARTGRFKYQHSDLKIGSLELNRLSRGGVLGHLEPFGNFTHDFDIMIAVKNVDIEIGQYLHSPGQPDLRVVVKFGSEVQVFDRRGSCGLCNFELIASNGFAKLELNQGFKYISPSGVEVFFDNSGQFSCSTVLSCAYATHVIYPDGTRLDFLYETVFVNNPQSSRLRRVLSNRGYGLYFEYAGPTWHGVSKICGMNHTVTAPVVPGNHLCPFGAQVVSSYTYVNSPELMLSSVTDAAGGVWNFSHGTDPQGRRTIGFIKPGQSSAYLTNHYMTTDGAGISGVGQDGIFEFVSRQSMSDGRSFDIAYMDAAIPTEYQIRQAIASTVTDNLGGTIQIEYGFPRYPKTLLPGYNGVGGGGEGTPIDWIPDDWSPGSGNASLWTKYQITPGPTMIRDELGRTTTFEYCDPAIAAGLPAGELDRCVVTPMRYSTDPEGMKYAPLHDVCGNLVQMRRIAKPNSGLADNVTIQTYECFQPKYANKPVMLREPNGQETNWTYSSVHGGMLTASLPPDANGIRPVTRYSYVQRSAWIKSGASFQAQAPIWLLASEKTCRTTATVGDSCAGGPSDEVVTTYDYGPNQGPNNLLLRGTAVIADGQTLRTCFAYDVLGNKISETSPRANLGSCP